METSNYQPDVEPNVYGLDQSQSKPAFEKSFSKTQSIAVEPDVIQPVCDNSPMLESEFIQLDELEAKARQALSDFAACIREIREKKLYRQGRDGVSRTWDEYCREVFGQVKQNIDREIRAYEIKIDLEKLETKVSTILTSRSHYLAFDGLDEIQRRAAFEIVKSKYDKKGKVTENTVKEAVKQISYPSGQLKVTNKTVADEPQNRDQIFDDPLAECLIRITDAFETLNNIDEKYMILNRDNHIGWKE